eukprot:7553335-Heterocapsa_arctica.AAC.1
MVRVDSVRLPKASMARINSTPTWRSPPQFTSPVRASTPCSMCRTRALHDARLSSAASASTPEAPRRNACVAA